MPQLHAGTATIDVTPPLGTFMGGYAARDHGAEGAHDSLRAKALALRAGDSSAILITCDIISFNYAFVDPIREAIAAATGVPVANVLVSNSHTHSGPLTHGVLGEDLVNEEYLRVLASKLISVGEMATERMQPATVGFARRDVSVGYNRRAMAQEEPLMGVPMRGALAPWVDVMAIRAEAAASSRHGSRMRRMRSCSAATTTSSQPTGRAPRRPRSRPCTLAALRCSRRAAAETSMPCAAAPGALRRFAATAARSRAR